MLVLKIAVMIRHEIYLALTKALKDLKGWQVVQL